jgi:hypothetical protein
LQPLAHLASIIRSPTFVAAEMPVKALFELYGPLGLNVVKTVVTVNPSVSKQDKADFLKAVQQLYVFCSMFFLLSLVCDWSLSLLSICCCLSALSGTAWHNV